VDFKDIYERYGYPLPPEGAVGIVALRSAAPEFSDGFDDFVGLVFHDGKSVLFKGTTDPGENDYQHVARAVPGFYDRAYKLGMHQGRYTAFVNHGWTPVAFTRPHAKDPSYVNKVTFIGLNVHRAHPGVVVDEVDSYSAGCLVVQDPKDFAQMLLLAQTGQDYYDLALFLLDEALEPG
jgi:hypothetical protein